MKNNISVACTICSYNYLSFGINCCESIKNHNEWLDVFLLIVDKCDNEIDLLSKDNIHYVYLEDLGIETEVLLEMKFKYNIIEMNTAVKPFFITHLLNIGYQNVLYLDPDTMCFNSLKKIEEILLNYDAIVTPHRITAINSKVLEDSVFLNNGLYNLGFFAIKNSENSKELLSWWGEKLKTQAFLDYAKGLATDQIWANFFPVYFDNVHILKHSGMNVAIWNIEERKITKVDNIFYINKDTLIFFHFSGFIFNKNMESKLNVEILDYPLLNELLDIYKKAVLSKKYEYYSSIKYGFNYYDNGELILPYFRRLYAELNPHVNFFSNPFSVSRNSFYYYFIRKNGRYMFSNLKNLDKGKKKYFILMKILILLFGVKFIIKNIKTLSAINIQNIAKLYYNG